MNLITDVAGLRVGNAADAGLKSGVTVLTADRPFVAAVDVRGGAPGTRETDLLEPSRLVAEIDALVLAGGSAFGLDAASGVTDRLRALGRGYRVGAVAVPIVPAAILFDLVNGGDKGWAANPYRDLGRAAFDAAAPRFELGSMGAGTGAMTADLMGGLGSASLVLEDRLTVGALVAVNAFGSTVAPGGRAFLAGAWEIGDEFGGLGPPRAPLPPLIAQSRKPGGLSDGGNTTIAIVATDAALDKVGAKRLAEAAQDGIGRAIWPAHTLFDGDLVFGVATGAARLGTAPKLDQAALDQAALDQAALDQVALGHAAAVCLARAVARAVHSARPAPGNLLACWSQSA